MSIDPSQQPQQPFQPPAASEPPLGVPAASFIPASVALGAKKPSQGRVATGTIVLVLAGFVAAAGIGFAGGRATAPQPAAAARNFGNGANGGNFPNASGFGGGNGAAGAFGALGGGGTEITGSVTAVGDGTLTITIAGGQSVTVTVPSTATYHGQTSASASDVAVGSQVQVSINRAGFRGGRPDASGAPGANPAAGGLTLTATDVTIVAK